MAAFAVKAIDHVVLTVKSIPKTVDFYTMRLGMKHETFTSKGIERHILPDIQAIPAAQDTADLPVPRHALSFGSQKLNLHLSGHEFEPKAGRVQPGSEDLCFITDHPVDQVLSSWKAAGIQVCASGRFRVHSMAFVRATGGFD